MRKSNLTYVFYQTFNLDLLFWIVIDNLFLTTVKGLGAFDIVLVTMVGLGLAILFYPLVNLIVKKISNKACIIISTSALMLAITIFTVCNSIYFFMFAQFLYCISSPFKQVSSVMLKNNLKEQNKEGDFVKWQSYGRLGYSIITLVVSLVAGFAFNVSPYLPMILSFTCTVIGLVFAIIYTEPKICKQEEQQNNTHKNEVSIKSLVTNKTLILLLLFNIFGVGAFMFMQSKSTLLIQYACENINMDIATISLVVSGIVFGSRVIRMLSNLFYPKIFEKVKNKRKIFIAMSLCLLLSGIFFAVGSYISTNFIVELIFITLGFYIILSIRDIYAVTESKIILNNLNDAEQKQAYVMASFFTLIGRLVVHAFALLILAYFSLEVLCIFMLIFSISQMIVGFYLSKYLK